MTIFHPSCFYHPVKIIFLDDNRAFLDTLELEFGNINMETCTNPEDAVQFINRGHKNVPQSILKPINNLDTDTADRIVGFEISKILDLIYDGTRFNNIPVIVVDYQMPDINGIDFCNKLKENNIFKIMLTAEADKDTAIKAFNNGVIDKFILKTSDTLYQELNLAINELTQRYFMESSQTIINGYGNSIRNLFNNELYQKLFNQILLETRSVEYYMVDYSGSFLFLDEDAIPTWLIVRNAKELNEQLELLQGYDIFDSLISSIEKKEKMLFLLSEIEYKKPVADWVQYVFESKKLHDDCYYSVIRGRLTDSINWNQVVPYATFGSAKVVNSIRLIAR
jgi:CheY-like chemotaxis protein